MALAALRTGSEEATLWSKIDFYYARRPQKYEQRAPQKIFLMIAKFKAFPFARNKRKKTTDSSRVCVWLMARIAVEHSHNNNNNNNQTSDCIQLIVLGELDATVK